MTDDLQEIDGVGPAREEDLNELGYEEYSDLAEAGAEELAEDVERLSEDRALELIVQAENLTDLEEAEVSDSDDESEDAESDSETIEVSEEVGDGDDEETSSEPTDDDSEDAGDDGQAETVTLELGFDNDDQYDTFFYTVYEARNNYIRTNRVEQTDYLENILDSLRQVGPDGSISVELEPQELHDLHNEIRGQIVDYQGENLMEQHDELRQVQNSVDEVRSAELF